MSKISGDHHYVPKAILKNFCFSGKSVFYLRKNGRTKDIEPRNINSIFSRRHYNTFVRSDGQRTDALEKFFANEFDNYIVGWVAQFEEAIRTGILRFHSDHNRRRFIQIFFNHTKRSPDFIEPIVSAAAKETFHPNLIEEIEQKIRPLTVDEKARLSHPDTQNSITNNSRVVNLSTQAEEVLEVLASLKIFVATPERQGKQFGDYILDKAAA